MAPSVILSDLTGDGVDEIVVRAFETLVFKCDQGAMEVQLLTPDQGSEERPAPWRDRVIDMNANGLHELLLAYEFRGANNYTLIVEIYEWNGERFRSLISEDAVAPSIIRSGSVVSDRATMYNGRLELEDVDANGTLDLVLVGGTAGGIDAVRNGGPQRSERYIWKWNGAEYVLDEARFSTPEYRFEAVQDGDAASLKEEFEKAIASYRIAIEDPSLQGWNPARLGFDSLVGEGTPAPTYPPTDPDERTRLEAYARYRIMLIHLVMGRNEAAEQELAILRRRFSGQSPASPFVQLAEIAWDTYLETEDVGSACEDAIDFARAHQEGVLRPLGSSYYGWLNQDYSPADICPFGESLD